MNLEDLPYDKIYEMCETLDLVDLNKFVRTSKQNRDICQSILDKKFEEEVELVTKQIYEQPQYIKIFETGPYESSIIRFHDGGEAPWDEAYIEQEDTVRMTPKMWIFHLNVEYTSDEPKRITQFSENFSLSDVGKYIKLLMVNGYRKY